MSKNSLFCPKKESSITQKVLIEIFFNVIFHLMYMVWLDLDAKSALDTGTTSVEAHKCAVYMLTVYRAVKYRVAKKKVKISRRMYTSWQTYFFLKGMSNKYYEFFFTFHLSLKYLYVKWYDVEWKIIWSVYNIFTKCVPVYFESFTYI